MDEKLKTNAKKLSPEEQYQIRESIIRLLKSGKSNRETAKILEVSERLVCAVKKAYAEQGIAGIKPKKRGRKTGEKRTLTPEHENEIRHLLADKSPEQLKLPGCMWTRENIRDLIRGKYGILMPLSTLGYYLSRWGFSVQRPAKRAYNQDEKHVEKWLSEEFPSIKERAEAENAEIFWGGESVVQNTSSYVRGCEPLSKTPVFNVEVQKIRVNMLSAISNRGKLCFLLYRDTISSDKLIDFMRRLVRGAAKKVFLILDNLRAHPSKKVTAWLERHKNEIEVFYPPPYSPEYNPYKPLSNDLKRGVGNRHASLS